MGSPELTVHAWRRRRLLLLLLLLLLMPPPSAPLSVAHCTLSVPASTLPPPCLNPPATCPFAHFVNPLQPAVTAA